MIGYYKTRTSNGAKKRGKKSVVQIKERESVTNDLSAVRSTPLNSNIFFLLKYLYKFPEDELVCKQVCLFNSSKRSFPNSDLVAHHLTGRETMMSCIQRISSGDFFRAKGDDLFIRNLRLKAPFGESFRFSDEAQQISKRFMNNLESDIQITNEQDLLQKLCIRFGKDSLLLKTFKTSVLQFVHILLCLLLWIVFIHATVSYHLY